MLPPGECMGEPSRGERESRKDGGMWASYHESYVAASVPYRLSRR
jgi:hypothetical protein